MNCFREPIGFTHTHTRVRVTVNLCKDIVLMSVSWLRRAIVAQDVTTGENWMKGTQDLSVIFLKPPVTL